jgi:hypothetical protein
MNAFLWGALTAASLVAALLFLRSWRVGRDRLFLCFALAFVAFAANWTALALVEMATEGRYIVYLLRLAGFLCIVAGILDKNRRSRLLQGDRVKR